MKKAFLLTFSFLLLVGLQLRAQENKEELQETKKAKTAELKEAEAELKKTTEAGKRAQIRYRQDYGRIDPLPALEKGSVE